MLLHQNLIIGFIGTYTKNESNGIYKFSFNLSTGKIESINLAYKIGNPTYLAIDNDRKILYSTCTIDNEAGVSSFKFWKEKDSINLINNNLSETKAPCHISISSNKEILISSNYHENKMIVYNTLDGIILNSNNIGEDFETSSNPSIQRQPHIHCSIFTHDEKYILSIDLGLDKMMVYKLDNNKLVQRNDLRYSFPKGTGPRHLAYSLVNPFYYVLSELTSKIFVFKYDCNSKTPFENIQILSSLSDNYIGEKCGAAIKIHMNNKFLYTSDRGNNSISLFYIDDKNGKLEYIDNTPCNGNSPRDFQIDPTGKFLICANEKSNNISIFSIDPLTGILTAIESKKVPNPTCIKFIY